MIRISTNIKDVKRGLRSVLPRVQAATPGFFKSQQGGVQQQGKDIVRQVVYAAFPEGKYKRRGTSTAAHGILNSITTLLDRSGNGITLGILSGSSALADTIPKTPRGRAVSDTYAAFMITGGGFLAPLGTDVRDFLEVWVRFFEITLPHKYLRDVVIPATRSAL
jgi:hypothetical protein